MSKNSKLLGKDYITDLEETMKIIMEGDGE